jgi:hypothetical protein
MPRSAADAFDDLDLEVDRSKSPSSNPIVSDLIPEDDSIRMARMRKSGKSTKVKDMSPLDREQLERESLMLQQIGRKKGGVVTTRRISTAAKSKKQSSW